MVLEGETGQTKKKVKERKKIIELVKRLMLRLKEGVENKGRELKKEAKKREHKKKQRPVIYTSPRERANNKQTNKKDEHRNVIKKKKKI